MPRLMPEHLHPRQRPYSPAQNHHPDQCLLRDAPLSLDRLILIDPKCRKRHKIYK